MATSDLFDERARRDQLERNLLRNFQEGDLNVPPSIPYDSTLPNLDGAGLLRKSLRNTLRPPRTATNGPHKAQVLHVYPRGTITGKPVVVARCPKLHSMLPCPGKYNLNIPEQKMLYWAAIKSHMAIAMFEADTVDEDTPGLGDIITISYADVRSFSGGVYRWRLSERAFAPSVLRESPTEPSPNQLGTSFALNTGQNEVAEEGLPGGPWNERDPSDVINIVVHSTDTPESFVAYTQMDIDVQSGTVHMPTPIPYGRSVLRALRHGIPSTDRHLRLSEARGHESSEFHPGGITITSEQFWAAVDAFQRANPETRLVEAAADQTAESWGSRTDGKSTHFQIFHGGTIVQLLPALSNETFHAGGPGNENANPYSVGIDLEGMPTNHTPQQWAALKMLVNSIELKHLVIVGHRHLFRGSSGRSDPGNLDDFPWDEEPFKSRSPDRVGYDPAALANLLPNGSALSLDEAEDAGLIARGPQGLRKPEIQAAYDRGFAAERSTGSFKDFTNYIDRTELYVSYFRDQDRPLAMGTSPTPTIPV